MKLETDWKSVNAKPEAVFAFLSDMNNMQKLMPEQVINWTSDGESCQFMIKGMAELGMKITNKTASSSIGCPIDDLFWHELLHVVHV
jgi:carbon monoxide dehydrogenase subunit G